MEDRITCFSGGPSINYVISFSCFVPHAHYSSDWPNVWCDQTVQLNFYNSVQKRITDFVYAIVCSFSEDSFFQICGIFQYNINWLCFDFTWSCIEKYHNLERNEDNATVFLKWTDFKRLIGKKRKTGDPIMCFSMGPSIDELLLYFWPSKTIIIVW